MYKEQPWNKNTKMHHKHCWYFPWPPQELSCSAPLWHTAATTPRSALLPPSAKNSTKPWISWLQSKRLWFSDVSPYADITADLISQLSLSIKQRRNTSATIVTKPWQLHSQYLIKTMKLLHLYTKIFLSQDLEELWLATEQHYLALTWSFRKRRYFFYFFFFEFFVHVLLEGICFKTEITKSWELL